MNEERPSKIDTWKVLDNENRRCDCSGIIDNMLLVLCVRSCEPGSRRGMILWGQGVIHGVYFLKSRREKDAGIYSHCRSGSGPFLFFFFGFVLFILFLFSPLWGPGQGFSRVFFQSLEQASKLLLFETLG